MGPILPFLPVIGKQLGVSEIVMGGVNAVLPLLFIVVKPLFGFLIDYFQEWRKAIFVGLLAATSFIYGSMAFLPETKKPVRLSLNCSELKPCASTVSINLRFLYHKTYFFSLYCTKFNRSSAWHISFLVLGI
ncbi:hypothetical protein AAG570_003314 [Ranatra chinensis]|uniref:Uncharacterized protein n=1 Tax=Ranatra chinensis TaxID=642074 RepID=A0ABD0Y6G6_9HEMI